MFKQCTDKQNLFILQIHWKMSFRRGGGGGGFRGGRGGGGFRGGGGGDRRSK